jgi:hypothetical protein
MAKSRDSELKNNGELFAELLCPIIGWLQIDNKNFNY